MTKKNTAKNNKRMILTVDEIKQLVNSKEKIFAKKKKLLPDYMAKTPESEEFTYQVVPCGNSGHIRIGKRWLGRFVKVNVEEVKEE